MQISDKKFFIKISGEKAMFTDPLSQMAGKTSYQIPTHSALRGAIERIYWKPSIQICIDRIQVLAPFKYTVVNSLQTVDLGFEKKTPYRLTKGNSQRHPHSYLYKPCYIVEFHLEWNTRAVMTDMNNPNKHIAIMGRRIEAGYTDGLMCFGTKECMVEYEKCDGFSDESVYQFINHSFGPMFWGAYYPDGSATETNKLLRYFSPVMQNGIVEYPHHSSFPEPGAEPVDGKFTRQAGLHTKHQYIDKPSLATAEDDE